MEPAVSCAPVPLNPEYGSNPRDIGFGMSCDAPDLINSDCTSCAVRQDKSAYWAPALYFIHTDGTAEIVDEVGGMLV